MIFLGDIAHPFDTKPDFSTLLAAAGHQPCVVNLEGPLSPKTAWLNEQRLFNHTSVLDSLAAIDTRVATLANNHICDLPDGISTTREMLTRVGISVAGAGANLAEASEPAQFIDDDREVYIVAFGWRTIRCRPATSVSPGVQPFEPKRVLQQISALRKAHPNAILIPVFHWNYELEPHPQPAHRCLAFAAVDAGADAVIGHHPHCVGGFEYHHGKLIAYSLGNWWMPHSVYFDGKLSFPDYTLKQVALEWHPNQVAKLHWFSYDCGMHTIEHTRTHDLMPESIDDGQTPYAGFSEKEYYHWFVSNRLKRKALPVYSDIDARLMNSLYDTYISWRHRMVVGIKKITGRL